MTITVRTTQGHVVNFPDGTSPDTIKEVMDKHFGSQTAEPAKPDSPIKAQVRKEYEADKARMDKGWAGMNTGFGRQFGQGLTFNAADEILAGLHTPIEMIRRGTFNPLTGYEYAKAREDVELEDARKQGGLAGTAAEIGGGVLSGVGLAGKGLSATGLLSKVPGPVGKTFGGLLGNVGSKGLTGYGASMGVAATEGGAFGGLSGLMEGEGTDRLGNAAVGTIAGSVLGPALSTLGSGLGYVAAKPLSWARAMINPKGSAVSQMARGAIDSGKPVAQIGQEMSDAAAMGQPYTAADAMGMQGKELLSATVRAPGPAQAFGTKFLQDRQLGQPERIGAMLEDTLGARGVTAQTTERAMTAAQKAAADIAYPAARRNAGPVDMTRVIARIDDTLQPGSNQIMRPIAYSHHGQQIGPSQLANDSIETALDGLRRRITNDQEILTNFTAVERVRDDLASGLEKMTGNRARIMGSVLRELDNAMENASPGFKAANRAYSQASDDIGAIATGRTAAMRGRPEDTISAFRELPQRGQQAHRIGYADARLEKLNSASGPAGEGLGANSARTYTAPKVNKEMAEQSLYHGPYRPGEANQFQKFIDRENTMYGTASRALTGSKTDMNFMNQENLKIDPGLLSSLASHNYVGAAYRLLGMVSNGWNANTPAVRAELAKMLLETGNANGMQSALAEAERRILRMQANMNLLSSGTRAGTGLAIASSRQ